MDTLLQEEEFTIVSTDESFFFFYDSLVRKVWIRKDERPIVRITGSSRISFIWCYKSGRKTIVQTV